MHLITHRLVSIYILKTETDRSYFSSHLKALSNAFFRTKYLQLRGLHPWKSLPILTSWWVSVWINIISCMLPRLYRYWRFYYISNLLNLIIVNLFHENISSTSKVSPMDVSPKPSPIKDNSSIRVSFCLNKNKIVSFMCLCRECWFLNDRKNRIDHYSETRKKPRNSGTEVLQYYSHGCSFLKLIICLIVRLSTSSKLCNFLFY